MLLWAVNGFAQTGKKTPVKTPAPPKKVTVSTPKQPKAKIEVLQSNVAKYDTSYVAAHRLIGNVVFRHENMLMFCDSAWFYETKSQIKAYGHIHVQQGDTLNVYGDSLDYRGNTKIAKLKGHVRMVEKDLVMVTDSVTYDAKKAIGYYNNGATITSAKNKNTLTSKTGYYHSRSKNFYFRGNVVLKNPESQLKTDTLRYHIGSETAYFVAPTTITMEDTTEMITSNGWYDTRKDKSALFDRSQLRKKEKTVTADTIYYDKKTELANLLGKAWMYDTTQQTGLFGNYALYNEKEETMLLTKSAYMVKKFDKDTFYLAADTIASYKIFKDSSEYMAVKAYHHVQFMKGEMLGRADSLHYSESDSLIRFYNEPVLWQALNQLTGDYMQARVVDNHIQNIFIQANSFIISEADTVGYNQIKGRNIYAYFKDDDLVKIKVEGNGQTLYYVGEEGKKISAVNRADCSDIILHMKDEKIDRITFVYQPDATLYPIDKYPDSEKYLKDFKWRGEVKPTEKEFAPVMDFIEQYGFLPK